MTKTNVKQYPVWMGLPYSVWSNPLELAKMLRTVEDKTHQYLRQDIVNRQTTQLTYDIQRDEYFVATDQNKKDHRFEVQDLRPEQLQDALYVIERLLTVWEDSGIVPTPPVEFDLATYGLPQSRLFC